MDKRTKLSINFERKRNDSSFEEDELIMGLPIQTAFENLVLKTI